MHVVLHEPRHRIEHLLRMRGRLRGDQLRVAVLRLASALFNDPHLWCAERVSVEHLRQGDVRLVFSVLHAPFNEWDLQRHFGAPPEDIYFSTVEAQIEDVETDLRKWPTSVVTHVRDADELERMSIDATDRTFDLLDELAPDMPVINSHAGFRLGSQEYMLDAPTIERIAARPGGRRPDHGAASAQRRTQGSERRGSRSRSR
jgi:hypothetical protein